MRVSDSVSREALLDAKKRYWFLVSWSQAGSVATIRYSTT